MPNVFQLPDTITALPVRPFEFSPGTGEQATALLSKPPNQLFHHLVRDQESEAVLLSSRRIIEAFLPVKRPAWARTDALPQDAEGILGHLRSVRTELGSTLAGLGLEAPEVREQVVRQRAPLGLLAGCWLDMVSQPATQPAVVVNRLVAQQWVLRGEGHPDRSVHSRRRRALQDRGIDLPEVSAPDFLDRARSRPLTALHACFYVALSRLPANFLPEVVAVNYVFHILGVDDLLAGQAPFLSDQRLTAGLDEFLALAGEPERNRLRAAIRLAVSLECEHVGMLADLAAWAGSRSLEAKVADIIARHAPMAGRQHEAVQVGGRPLAELFRDPDPDWAAFIREFRESPMVRPSKGGTARWIQAMKFGGPMFGIFDEREAAVFKEWVESVASGARPDVEVPPNRVGDQAADMWVKAIEAGNPEDVVFAAARPADDRELFYRLVNIENFPNTLPLAARMAAERFAEAEVLFTHGQGGRFTDASWFDYTPDALFERGGKVYWEKLVDPYQPIVDMPDRDEVTFTQSTYALGSLIDGAWIHRIGNLGHRSRVSDEMLYNIYADEMGFGDQRKNHLTLIHRVLASMDIQMAHIRDPEFMQQRDLPDELYGSSLHQLCMCLHPDTFYNEILGYNFAIEMFGSGEFRLHEGQKLRHHGFDDCYEVAHLAIDNFSSGHTRQAADIIVAYLEDVRRVVGEAAVQQQWRRIWSGYASFAWFVEQPMLRGLAAGANGPAEASPAEDMADLIL